jgi:hypothetical protein
LVRLQIPPPPRKPAPPDRNGTSAADDKINQRRRTPNGATMSTVTGEPEQSGNETRGTLWENLRPHRRVMIMAIIMSGVISSLFVIMAVEAWMNDQLPLVFIWAITAVVMFTSMPIALAMMLRTVR